MKYHLLFVRLLYLWLILSGTVRAQEIRLFRIDGSFCYGTEASVLYETRGSFKPDNSLQILITSEQVSFTKVLQAQVLGDRISLPLTAPLFSESEHANRIFYVQVVSTSPEVISTRYPFRLKGRPEVRLVDTEWRDVHPYDPLRLKFQVKSSVPVEVEMSDSAEFRLKTDSYDYTAFESEVTVYPPGSRTYQVQKVRNECGVGTAMGQVTVRASSLGLRTTDVSPLWPCAGEPVYVRYSVLGGAFNPGNRFRLRLTRLRYGQTFQELPTDFFELDAVEENGLLKATLPPTVPRSDFGNTFHLRVVSSSPAVVSTQPVVVTLFDAPAVFFRTRDTTVAFGQEATLLVGLRGVGPFYARLNDGRYVSLLDGFDGSFFDANRFANGATAVLKWVPQTSQTLAIESFVSGCSSRPLPEPGTARVNVLPGIRVDSLPAYVCEGQEVRLRFSSSVPLPEETLVNVEVHQSGQLNGPFVVREGRKRGNHVVFSSQGLIVNLLNGPQTSYYLRLRVPEFGLSTAGPGVPTLRIFARPSAQWASTNVTGIDEPRRLRWDIQITGGGSSQVTIAGDQGEFVLAQPQEFAFRPFEFTPQTTQTYRIVSVTNQCFTTRLNASATVVVNRPALRGIEVQASNQLCLNDSLRLNFRAVGPFNAGNRFRLLVADRPDVGVDVMTELAPDVQPGQLRFRYTARPFQTELYVMVVSTNPQMTSNLVGLTLIPSPTAAFETSRLTGNEILAGETFHLPVALSGTGPYQLTFTDGTQTVTSPVGFGTPNQTWLVPVAPRQTTTYQLLRVQNACGTAALTAKPLTVTVQPYRIRLFPIANSLNRLCVGTPLQATADVEGPLPPPATRYTLQIASARDSVFRDLASNLTLGPTWVTIPATAPAGETLFRLVSTDQIVSNIQKAALAQPPTARLEGASPSRLVTWEEQAVLSASLAGTTPIALVFSDGLSAGSFQVGQPVRTTVVPSQSTLYSIGMVANTCGYGSATGTARVDINPMVLLELNSPDASCPGEVVPFSVRSRGFADPLNRFRVGIRSGATGPIRWLEDLPSGNRISRVTLPGDVTATGLQLVIQSSSPVRESAVPLNIVARPDFALTSSAIINPGGEAALLLRPSSTGIKAVFLDYQLSDGTAGQVSGLDAPILIRVRPLQTTTYRITRLTDRCGPLNVTGSATVEVNAPASRELLVKSVVEAILCTGRRVTLNYEKKGDFPTNTRFLVQLSDTTGANYRTIPTDSTSTQPLVATLPADLPEGSGYRFRVITPTVTVASAASPLPYTVFRTATAVFDKPLISVLPGDTARYNLLLTGTPPWQVRLANDSRAYLPARSPISFFTVLQGNALVVRKIESVQNVCGPGVILEPSSVQIELITALEPSATPLRVFPNPTADRIRLEGFAAPTTVELFAPTGALLRRVRSAGEALELDLSPLPAGAYLLRVHADTGPVAYRVLKQ